MDRQIIYPGQIPLETDLLNTNRNTMIAIAKLSAAIMGTGGVVSGLLVTPSIPAALTVSVGQGEIYSLQNVDNSTFSSLPADTTDTIVKQGIQLAAVSLACAAPTTAGQSINYLIEATYQDADTGLVTLPYYNASNPGTAYSGPGGSGTAQATARQGLVSLVAKPGISATSGTQVTPTVDAGYIALAVVTVSYNQTTINAVNIKAIVSTQVLTQSIAASLTGRLLNTQVFSTSGAGTYTPTPGTKSISAIICAGGGAGGGAAATNASQYAAGAGGASGSYVQFALAISAASYAFTIGAGGSGISGANGNAGGNSTFSTLVIAPGGVGGVAGTAVTSPTTTVPVGTITIPTVTAPAIAQLIVPGGYGDPGLAISAGMPIAGRGNNSPIGTRNYAFSIGSGGQGAANGVSGSAGAGVAGGSGYLMITEYY